MATSGNSDAGSAENSIVYQLLISMRATQAMTAERHWENELQKPRNADPRRLLRHGYKVFSQNDEDGIIAEIFKRIGIETRTFVEIGVGDGLECNTVRLLLDSWTGMWIESDPAAIKAIRNGICPGYKNSLVVMEALVTAANVNRLIGDQGSLDLLSIDIDFNDYWVWKAVEAKPRVVVIEYNATWRPPLSVTVPYDANGGWNGTSYHGASLEAMVRLGNEKGYKLVGCNYTGSNAFFVRDDLVSDKFMEQFTAEEHYEPLRYAFWLLNGHVPGMGPLVRI